MDCMKSFTFVSGANENVTAPNIVTWGLAPNTYWLYQHGSGQSTFNIQGFKNINVHAIEAVGDVSSLLTGGTTVLVNDWRFLVQISGQNPQVSGNITAAPNRFSIVTQPQDPIVGLSRYQTRIDFASPIQSAKSIQIVGLTASGIAAQNPANINLAWYMTFIVYYTFEGE